MSTLLIILLPLLIFFIIISIAIGIIKSIDEGTCYIRSPRKYSKPTDGLGRVLPYHSKPTVFDYYTFYCAWFVGLLPFIIALAILYSCAVTHVSVVRHLQLS